MSTRRKADEHTSQESVGIQSLRSAKEKEKDKGAQPTVAGATAAAVAATAAAVAATAKLERMVHIAEHTPNKGGQHAQTKSTDRKSQGLPSLPTCASGIKNPTSKGPGGTAKERAPCHLNTSSGRRTLPERHSLGN